MRREAEPICDQLPGELFGRGLIGAVSRGDVVARRASVVVMAASILRVPPVTMATRWSMRSMVDS
jgi:hypothetical protein